jgi:hypothetical protein
LEGLGKDFRVVDDSARVALELRLQGFAEMMAWRRA